MASLVQKMNPVHLVQRSQLRGEVPRVAQPDPSFKKMQTKRAKKSQPDMAIPGM